MSPDGRWLAAEATPSSVAVVDLERGSIAFTFREERSPVWSLARSRDARRLAVDLSDGGLVAWDRDAVRARLTSIHWINDREQDQDLTEREIRLTRCVLRQRVLPAAP